MVVDDDANMVDDDANIVDDNANMDLRPVYQTVFRPTYKMMEMIIC